MFLEFFYKLIKNEKLKYHASIKYSTPWVNTLEKPLWQRIQLWVFLGLMYLLSTPGFGDFVPFFLADLLKLGRVGWGVSVNSNLQVFPQILNGIQVWALAGPLKDFHILVVKIFQCCFGCMLGVIVLLERRSSPQSTVFCTLKQVLLKNLPVFGSIHCCLYP